jgi:hypothetical protein
MLEWIVGLGIAGYIAGKFQESDRKEKEARQKARQQEQLRKNSICLFQDGISRDDFEKIANIVCRRVKRISSINVNGPIISCTVRTQSGISEWKFKVDFNDFGHITGKYWLSSENNDSKIPKVIADGICDELRSFNGSNRNFEHASSSESSSYSESRIHFCPNCGYKIEKPTARFCSNCGERLPAPESNQRSFR